MNIIATVLVLLCLINTITTENTPHHTIKLTNHTVIQYNAISDNTTQWTEFQEFMQYYNKVYPSLAIEIYRFGVFKQNLAIIAQVNAQHINNIDPSLAYNITDLTVYGINQFSDLTADEFNALYRTYIKASPDVTQPIEPVTEAPISVYNSTLNITNVTVAIDTGFTLNISQVINETTTIADVANDTIIPTSIFITPSAPTVTINNTLNTVRRKLQQFATTAPKLPMRVNWADMGATTAIGSQGNCGSCWSFSSVEQLETQYFIQSGYLPQLSVQQVTSCDPHNNGCQGGDPTATYQYLNTAGVMPAIYDQYTNGDSSTTESCVYNAVDAVYRLTAWRWASPVCTSADPTCANVNEALLATQVAAYGPASICLTAQNFQYYTGGILNDLTCPTGLYSMDHCLQLVGFDTNSNGQKYWILRNQWGTTWGVNGYMYLAMGANLCGVANEASFITAE